MSIKIITDSTSYIPKEIRDKYDINVISLNISIADKNFREIDVDNKEFYKMIDEFKEFPKSSQPALGEVEYLFEEIAKNGDDIVGIFISSEMSGTYSSTNLIKEMILEKYPERKIELIDSRSNCMQMGLAVIEAAKKANEGATIEEVVATCKDVMSKSKFLFTPETLEYLKMGGRIGSASALFGSILKIKPILTVNDGKTDVVEKVRTKKKAVDSIVGYFLKEVEEKGLGDAVIHHINCEEEALKIANEISEKLNSEIKIVSIGPVIGAHVGPGAVGIAYFTK
ncbi:DegV family protein [Clostridium sp.]|uniref:DegV family protein n=1 Tax=Clostridium sp. TaxID=1506 RepID=UPI003F3FE1C5